MFFLRNNALEIRLADSLKQCDSQAIDMIHVADSSLGRQAIQQPIQFMFPIQEPIEPVILARIPQQIERKEARLATSEWQILELRSAQLIQAHDLAIEDGIIRQRQSRSDSFR